MGVRVVKALPGAALVALLVVAAPASAAVVAVPGSPFGLGNGATGPAGLAFSPNGAFVATANQTSDSVSVFHVDGASGALTAASGSPTSTGPSTAPSSVGFSPDSRLVAVAITQGGAGKVLIFSVDATTGALTAVGSPVSTSATAANRVAFSPNGNLLAVSGGTGSVATFSVGSSGGLTNPQTSPTPTANASTNALAFNPSGSLLAVTETRPPAKLGYPSGEVVLMSVNYATGKLTSVPGSLTAVGNDAGDVAFSRDGSWLAATSVGEIGAGWSTLSVFSVDASGALVPQSGFTSLRGITGVAFNAADGIAAADSNPSGGVRLFDLNRSTGALTEIPGSPFSAGVGTHPSDVAFSPSGAWLASANYSNDSVSVLSVSSGSAGIPVTAPEGTQKTLTVAHDPCAVSGEAAAIDWGDGTAATSATFDSNGNATGSHTYAEEGDYVGALTFSDACGGTTAPFKAYVADGALTPGLAVVSGVAGAPVNGTIAQFSDADPAGAPSDYAATIDWGDGSAHSAGSVIPAATSGFKVRGVHTYARGGAFQITVVISDNGVASTTVNPIATVIVYPPSVGAVSVVRVGSRSATVSAKVAPDGLPTTMHFEYGRVGRRGQVAFRKRTPERTVGSDFTRHTMTARLKGLVPNATYAVRAVADGYATVRSDGQVFATARARRHRQQRLIRTFKLSPGPGPLLFELPPRAGLARLAQARWSYHA
jgi:6-phosphogluconolactonase (cycloisomerase 2 family)